MHIQSLQVFRNDKTNKQTHTQKQELKKINKTGPLIKSHPSLLGEIGIKSQISNSNVIRRKCSVEKMARKLFFECFSIVTKTYFGHFFLASAISAKGDCNVFPLVYSLRFYYILFFCLSNPFHLSSSFLIFLLLVSLIVLRAEFPLGTFSNILLILFCCCSDKNPSAKMRQSPG